MILQPAGAMTKIGEIVSTGVSGIFTFSPIPQNFKHLMGVAVGRGDTAALIVGGNITFNNDTGANYERQLNTASNATLTAAQATAAANISGLIFSAATDTANYGTSLQFVIPFYSGTTFNKTILLWSFNNQLAAGSLGNRFLTGAWNNTAAITRMDITLGSGNFVSGSKIDLYGIA